MTTQKDIARRLNVSVTLVSRVLSGQAQRIGAASETVQRIEAAALAMGYVPNSTARILRGSPTQTIGVVVFDFEDPYFGTLMGRLQHAARNRGRSLVIMGFERRQPDLQSLAPLFKHAVDGLIVAGSTPTLDWIPAQFLNRIPITQIGNGPRQNSVYSISVDNSAGIKLLLAHLKKRGHQRIGFVGLTDFAHQLRRDAFLFWSSAYKMSPPPRWIFTGELTSETLAAHAAQTVKKTPANERPTALMAASDRMAIHLIHALQEQGLSVPGDMAVTGFDDIPIGRLMTPALTTAHQPVPGMARAAMDWILSNPKPGQAAGKALVTLPRLIIRNSTERA